MAISADLFRLAVSHHQKGDLAQAEALYRQILGSDPRHAGALHLLGVLSNQTGRHDVGIPLIRQAIALNPSVALYHTNLGIALVENSQGADGIESFRQALRLDPNNAEVHNDLGNLFYKQGLLAEASEHYQQVLRLNPLHAEACYNLGNALFEQGRHTDAALAINQVLRLNPNHVKAHISLGVIFSYQGRLDEASACFAKALELEPDNTEAHSNLIYALHFLTGQIPSAILEECRRWNQRHAEPLKKFMLPHANDKTPGRRLRIGYVSPDFRMHAVGRFLLPFLENHDHSQFEIFCYSSVKFPDNLTERCRSLADAWRPIFAMADEEVAQLIRQDGIDILVDLAMHTANNRLPVFARKPAPIQVSYLAYCGTTGLDAMDFRLTDPYLDPPNQNDRFYSEQSIHLPNTYWCYQPVLDDAVPATHPVQPEGSVTFGCLNSFWKVTDPTLETWSRLLQKLPEARLLLSAHAGSHRERVRHFFSERAVSPDRLLFTDKVPLAEYFRIYERIDVVLDPFPYGGGTTTCDALWMGVPVVSLAGQTAVGRGGVSILSNIGLTELLAQNVDEYVRIAQELAGDSPRRSELRASLRDRMRNSPLMDAPRFARDIEVAYKSMWKNWCARK